MRRGSEDERNTSPASNAGGDMNQAWSTESVEASCLSLPAVGTGVRPRVRGKFLFVGETKLYLRGVTYGPFRPDPDGGRYHTPEVAERDFRLMAAQGINAIRTYTVPPRWLLDVAQRHGLWVTIGLPVERHAIFLNDRQRVRSNEEWVRDEVRSCAGHPAVLCYTVGNEIPASVVRLYGHHRVESYLQR